MLACPAFLTHHLARFLGVGMVRSFIAATVLVVVSATAGAMAQPAAAPDGPAELPPASFSGQSYVDSKGCAFLRVMVNGAQGWAARLTPDRKAVCGEAPSLPKPAAQEAAAEKSGALAAPAAASGKAAGLPVTPPKVVAQKAPPVVQKVARAVKPVMQPAAKAAPAPVAVTSSAAPAKLRTMIVKQDGLWRQIEVTGVVPAAKSRIVMGHYIQVGAYGRPANAEAARQALRKTGLPVRTAMVQKGQAALELVLAGPFDDSATAGKALITARKAGFHDAFHL